MNYDDLRDLGSQTARGGFRNEDDVVAKFNNWQKDEDAQKWLLIMKYNLDEIEYVKAYKITREKTDVQVQITVTIKLKKLMDVQNLQVKLVSNLRGFNQIDKRWVDNYVQLWGMPSDVVLLLKKFTGEIMPNVANPRDSRRMFADEFADADRNLILDFLRHNKAMIVNDILKGRGKLAAEWMLVVQKIEENARWVLKPMNFAVNFFGNGEIVVTREGSFKIGRITIQRKGGDAGRNTAKMLQFKINPAELFDA
jgi:hypothetical protein